MPSNGHGIFAVGGYPTSRGDTAVEKEEDVRVERKALKAKLCRDDTRFGWLAVDASRRCGRKLRATDLIEDDLIDGVGLVITPRAVDDNSAHGKLTDEGLAPRLGGDYP